MTRNPYRPGAAVRPAHLAGRERELARFRKSLAAAPEIPLNLRLTGLRGVGKSVLLAQMHDDAREEAWVASRLELEPRHNDEATLSLLLGQAAELELTKLSRARRLRSLGSRVLGAASYTITLEDVALTVDPTLGQPVRSLAQVLFRVTDVAATKGYAGYLLMLDEAQVIFDEPRAQRRQFPLSMLVAAVNTLQTNGLPVGVVLCGLPTLQANLINARTYTERMFRGEEIGSLDPETALEALMRPLVDTPITIDPTCATAIVAEVSGYPYFVQLWGAELFDAAIEADLRTIDIPLLDAVRPDIYDRLDRDFFEGRVASLTPAEQDVLLASGDCPYPPLRTSDLVGKTKKSAGNLNVLMGRLTEKGILYREVKGVYQYTAPGFHEFLSRRKQRRRRY